MRAYPAAILWVLVSTGIFAVLFASAKFAGGAVGTFQIMLLRYAASVVCLLGYAMVRGPGTSLRTPRLLTHFWRAVTGCGAVVAITWASARMPLADATALGMSYGMLSVCLGIALLHERVRPAHWGAVALTGLGAAVVLRGQGAFSGAGPGWPAVVALASAVLMAVEGVLIRVMSQQETALTLMLYVSGFGTVLMLGPALWEWQTLPVTGYALCLALGPVSILAQYCTIRGYRIAPLSVVGPVDYAWLLFAIALGAAVFGERPGPAVLAGGGLIVLGGVWLTRVRA
ncbi:MAG: DMT family transporter [Pseudomonadota bacterium]